MGTNDFDQFCDFINKIHPVKQDEAMIFFDLWKPITVKRKTLLTTKGETERYLYFVLEGIQRVFYIGEEDNKEATIIFSYPYSFSGIADSFLTQTPSGYYFESLTASRLLRINYEVLQDIAKKYPDIDTLLSRATAFALKGVIERQVELQCYSSEEKFRTLLKRSPHILNLVPHKYIASYIGIDPTNFSKLVSTIRI